MNLTLPFLVRPLPTSAPGPMSDLAERESQGGTWRPTKVLDVDASEQPANALHVRPAALVDEQIATVVRHADVDDEIGGRLDGAKHGDVIVLR